MQDRVSHARKPCGNNEGRRIRFLGLQKSGKTLAKASGFTAFCNPQVEPPYRLISWLLMKESYIPWLSSPYRSSVRCGQYMSVEII
jgi:hypothetical protein